MGLTIRLRIFNNVKHGAIYLKYGQRCFDSLTILGLELKGIVRSAINETVILYCKFSTFAIAVIF